jgi:hypothetical protein
MGNLLSMRSFLQLRSIPTPGCFDHAYDGLAAGVDVDMLDSHLLLTLAAMPIEGLEQY